MPSISPFVVPWKLGPVMPVGILPATTFHHTGVGVAPLLNVVLHPVVWKKTTADFPLVRLTAGCGVMVQLPVAGAGLTGTGFTEGVQPASVTVTVGVRLSGCPVVRDRHLAVRGGEVAGRNLEQSVLVRPSTG
jgi:hypothetical protein